MTNQNVKVETGYIIMSSKYKKNILMTECIDRTVGKVTTWYKKTSS